MSQFTDEEIKKLKNLANSEFRRIEDPSNIRSCFQEKAFILCAREHEIKWLNENIPKNQIIGCAFALQKQKKINWVGWGVEALVETNCIGEYYYLQPSGKTLYAPYLSIRNPNNFLLDYQITALAPEPAQPWHPWLGGDRPFPEGIDFVAITRDGRQWRSLDNANYHFRWKYDELDQDSQSRTDVIRFKLIKISEGREA